MVFPLKASSKSSSPPSKTPEPLSVPLWELKANQCLYAVGEPAPRQHHFCAMPVLAGRPYCPSHQALCVITVDEARVTARRNAERYRRTRLAIKARLE